MTLLGVDGVDVAPSAHVEDHEDGEISEQGSIVTGVSKKEEADAGFIPLSEGSARKIVDDLDHTNEEFSDDDDDDVPEEMLNIIAKQKAAAAGVIVEEIDPKLCRVCQKEPHKYKCPKCDSRTCSLACIKQHKADDNCDGVRGPFTVVAKLSQYDEKKSIEDQAFIKTVQQKVYEPVTMSVPAGDASTMKHEGQMSDEQAGCHQQNGPMGDENAVNEDGTRNTAKNMQERYLIPNAGRRRIWLSFSDDKGGEDCTRHEQFSDSIFWCIDFVFTKKLEDGEMSEYTYRVQNIPETIRLCTVLKQFLKPRKYGCIVSESDLDLEKMAPFISAQPESIKMFMRVPRYENERYYVMNSERTLLDNTRNRVIVDHPKIIIVLEDECQNYQSLSEEEAEAIRERMQKERSAQNRNSGFRGRGGRGMGMRGRGGPPGDFGGGFGRGRGGFRGRGGSRGGFDGEGGRGGGWQTRGGGRGFQGGGKRPWNSSGGEDGAWKRGRGRGGSFGRGGGNNFRRDPVDFDPFEPFEGPVTLPMDYGNSPRLPAGGAKEDAAVSSWGKAVGAPKVKEEASGEQ